MERPPTPTLGPAGTRPGPGRHRTCPGGTGRGGWAANRSGTMAEVSAESSDTNRDAPHTGRPFDTTHRFDADSAQVVSGDAPEVEAPTVPSDSDPAAPSMSLMAVPSDHHDRFQPNDPRRSDVDEWGRSEHMRSILRRVYNPMYKYWFRVEWEGLEKIPRDGGALLIANHAGAIPPDAPAIMHGIEQELGRPVYGLADYFFRTVPVVGTLWSRTGGVPAHPDNAYRILHDQKQLALVFPEGTKATSKTYADRYRLRRFGRGGFVEIAMRAGVPVIPIAVVGAEESMPTVFRISGVAKMLGLPYFPVTVNSLLMGPIGYVTYFPTKIKLRVLDPVTFDVEPGLERYSRSRVMDEAERIRAIMQDALHDMLRERRSVWFG